MADPIYKTEKLKNPTPSALHRQAREARKLKITARAIGESELASSKGVRDVLGGAQVRLKAAKKGVYVGARHAQETSAKATQSHASPLRKIEQKVRKLARKFDPIAKKKLPRGPRTILGGLAVPQIVKAMTDRVLNIESRRRAANLRIGTREGGDT